MYVDVWRTISAYDPIQVDRLLAELEGEDEVAAAISAELERDPTRLYESVRLTWICSDKGAAEEADDESATASSQS